LGGNLLRLHSVEVVFWILLTQLDPRAVELLTEIPPLFEEEGHGGCDALIAKVAVPVDHVGDAAGTLS
jgi:hypothetical protein